MHQQAPGPLKLSRYIRWQSKGGETRLESGTSGTAMLLIPVDQTGLTSKVWQVLCCLRYKKKAQDSPLGTAPGVDTAGAESWGAALEYIASVPIVSPRDLIIRILGFDLLG